MPAKALIALCFAALVLLAACARPPTNGAGQPVDEHTGTPQPGVSSSY